MFTEQTLSGNKIEGRKISGDDEVKSIRKKAIRLKLFIYNEKIYNSTVSLMKKSAKKPVQTIATLSSGIMVKFEKDGGKVINDPELLEALSKLVIKELISIAVSLDILTKEQLGPDLLFRIVGLAQQKWDKQNPGRVDKERSKRMMEIGRKDPSMAESVSRQQQNSSMSEVGVEQQPGLSGEDGLPQEERPAQAPNPAQQPQGMPQPSPQQEQLEAPPQMPPETM